jgi:hypothetical protein
MSSVKNVFVYLISSYIINLHVFINKMNIKENKYMRALVLPVRHNEAHICI